MEKEEKKVLNNEEKMEILRGLQMIIWDANRLIGKLANCDDTGFDYEDFKHDFYSHCKWMINDVHLLMKIKLE